MSRSLKYEQSAALDVFNFSQFFLVYGFHPVQQYAKCGRTSEM